MDQPTYSTQNHSAAVRPALASTLLTAEELAQYHRDGFLVPKFHLSEDELERLRGLVLRLVAENPGLADYFMSSVHVPGAGTQGLKTFPGWMEFAAHRAILDVIEQIIGPDIILWGAVVFYKQAAKGLQTPWHRDASFIPINPLETASVWLAAFDSTRDNSCLRFIPGSHKSKTRGTHTVKPQKNWAAGLMIDESEYDESTAVDVEVKAGQMILFDIFTIHGARANSSARERGSLALRYMPATSRFEHDSTPAELTENGYGHSSRPLVLVRGKDRAGNDFKRGHPEPSTSMRERP